MVQYSFNKLCDPGRLSLEISSSNITIVLDHIETSSSPETTKVYFKAELSSEEQTILDDLISAHVDTPLPEEIPVVSLHQPKDSDGSPLQRLKVTTTGWHYQLHGLEFELSKIDSVYSKSADGLDFNFATMKFYKLDNGEEVEITGDDLNQNYLDANCIKTIIDWEVTYNIEIIGGMLKQFSIPSENVRLWVVGVPDVPAEYGGSKTFVANVNLAFIGVEGVRVDGRAPKFLEYNEIYHSNKLRMVFRHSAGLKHKLHMIYELFKP